MDDVAEAKFWRPLKEELQRWQSAGRTARLWLRDDDAIEPTAELEKLAKLAQAFQVPVVLAVIPARTGEPLARWLRSMPHIHPAVHGWSHHNHAPPNEKRQELGPHRPREVIFDELRQGLKHMRLLYAERLFPMLVPPWNRIDPALVEDLPRLGFAALSAFGPVPRTSPIPIINAHVDIIDSKAGNRARAPFQLLRQLADELARARAGGGYPVGILSHHLGGDAAALRFLKHLFQRTARHPACRWHAPVDLVQAGTSAS